MTKKIKSVSLTDRLQIPTQRKITDAGQMIVPCAFARIGSQEYSAIALGVQDAAEGDMIQVFRDESEVFSDASMETFRSAPVTLGHPKEDGAPVAVTSENAATYQKGMLEGMPTRDEDNLIGTLVITDQEAIDAIEAGERELSAGYTCDLIMEDAEDGTVRYSQTNIRANHIAIVAKGRAGSACAIADEKEAEDKVEGTKVQEKKAVVVDETPPKKIEDEPTLIYDQAMFDEALDKAVKAAVAERVSVIVRAKEVIADDLDDMSVVEIKKAVLLKVAPELSLSDKSEAYIDARFDIVFEDEDRETPMGRLLKEASKAQALIEDEKAKDEVGDARTRMINRNSKKEG